MRTQLYVPKILNLGCLQEKKNGEGKGGKCLEKKNIFFAEEKSFGKGKCHDSGHTHRQTDRHREDRARIRN